jgi:5,10-methylenetetrahydromethanopterin reductase
MKETSMADGQSVEFWASVRSLPGQTAPQAIQHEEEGWDGITYTDSQSMSGDVYVALATGAAATSRLKLGTGVTNPWTRHPAVAAAAISCVQVESGGRAELGVGRGDSSMARLGLAPASPAALERYLIQVQTYLSGGSVPVDIGDERGVETTQTVASVPTDSSLEWYKELGGVKKVPVFAVASGPKVLHLAARLADRVGLVLGADLDRIKWGISEARKENSQVPVSAYLSVVPHPDTDQAVEYARGIAGTFSRYSAMHGKVYAPTGQLDENALKSIATGYELQNHYKSSGHQATVLTPEFVRSFVILGSSEHCIERLQEIRDAGIDRFHVSMTTPDVDRGVAAQIRKRFVEEVMPAFR